MLLEPTDDQEFFRATTSRFLDEHAPPSRLRALRDDPAGFDLDHWRRGAELGWTALLVDEDLGGGSISDHGLIDLTLVAHEFGRHAAPGPLVPTNVAAGALGVDDAHHDLVAGVVDGSSVITWCLEEGPTRDALDVSLEIRVDGADLVLDGRKRPVESAGNASHLLVVGRTGAGLTQVVLPADTPGISMVPMRTIDLTRRFWAIDFDGVRVPAAAAVGQIGKADGDVERQLTHAVVLTNAEAVGAMQAAFDMTVEWSFDRYSFGRPLASYQALKHRFAMMTTWLEGSHAIADEAAAAVAREAPEAAELASAAKAFIGRYGPELAEECVQLHGGIGVTFEHDLHFFLRRATLDRALYGTPAEHQRRVAAYVAVRDTDRDGTDHEEIDT